MADAVELPADHPLLEEIGRVYAAHLTGEILDGAMVPEVFNALIESLQGATREEILEVAADATALLVERATETSKRGIAQALFEALDKQYSVDKTGRMLRESVGLTPQQVKSLFSFEAELADSELYSSDEIDAILAARRQELINERAKVIAQTEMRNAVETGEFTVANRRGMTHKTNVDSGDSKVSDICRRCSAQGPIPIGESFASGRDTAPHHPRCRCSTKYLFIEDPAHIEAARSRSDVRVERIDAARREAEEIREGLRAS